MASPSRALVFDLDGTLVDSLGDIVTSFLHALAEHGHPVPEREAVRARVGPPLEEMFAGFAPGDVLPLCDAYRRHYAVHGADTTAPYPGVVETLAELRARGYKLAVATTKRTDTALRLVEATGLKPLLDHVQGTDGFPHKPEPEVIRRALAALRAEGAWMVGDTITDIQAGKAAGLRTYAVTWGTHDRDLLATAAPDALEPDLGPLLELV